MKLGDKGYDKSITENVSSWMCFVLFPAQVSSTLDDSNTPIITPVRMARLIISELH
jgi:hypothetical protein